MRSGVPFAAALASLMASGKGGDAVLTDMFTPRLRLPNLDVPESHPKPGKHRNSGRGSPRRNGKTWWRVACGHKQARKYAAQGQGINVHYNARMAWLERNQHVIAKREADQLRARNGR